MDIIKCKCMLWEAMYPAYFLLTNFGANFSISCILNLTFKIILWHNG